MKGETMGKIFAGIIIVAILAICFWGGVLVEYFCELIRG